MSDDSKAEVCWTGIYEGIEYRLVAVREGGLVFPAMEQKERDLLGEPRWAEIKDLPLPALVLMSDYISKDPPTFWDPEDLDI